MLFGFKVEEYQRASWVFLVLTLISMFAVMSLVVFHLAGSRLLETLTYCVALFLTSGVVACVLSMLATLILIIKEATKDDE